MSIAPSLDDFLKDAQQLELGDIKLEYFVKGDGPPLLYLHGMDGVEGSAALIDLLAQQYKVYAPSHPGFGGSALPRHFSTVDDLSYFYLDLIEHLDLHDVTLVGFSLGGWIAAEMLVKDGARISKAILGAPLGLRTADRREQIVTDIFMLDAKEVEAQMQFSPSPMSDIAKLSEAELGRRARNAEAVALYGWSPYLYNPKLEQRLHRIKVPTLVLWGEEDRIAPSTYGGAYVSGIRNASLETIPSCGHRIYTDSPAAAAARIENFKNAAAG